VPDREPAAARRRLPLRWRAEAAVGASKGEGAARWWNGEQGGDGSRGMATAPASLHACGDGGVCEGYGPLYAPRAPAAVGGGAEASGRHARRRRFVRLGSQDPAHGELLGHGPSTL